MVEEYDFCDPKVRKPDRWLRATNKVLIGMLTAVSSYIAFETVPQLRPSSELVRMHDGVRLEVQADRWHPMTRKMDSFEGEYMIETIADELSKYPSGFVAEVCGVERVVVLESRLNPLFAAMYFSHANRIEIYSRSEDPVHENDVRLAVVHEVDRACNITNRTSDDIALWESYVQDPPRMIESFVQSFVAPRFSRVSSRPAPEGFARWYSATTARSWSPARRHVEDEATTKELITYGRSLLDVIEDPVLEAKARLLTDRYERWSGGVMDEDYFERWSELDFSYDRWRSEQGDHEHTEGRTF